MGKILDWHPNTVNQWVRYYGDVLAEWAVFTSGKEEKLLGALPITKDVSSLGSRVASEVARLAESWKCKDFVIAMSFDTTV